MLKEHLLAVKARMQASLQTAIEQENADSNKRLATKQVQTCLLDSMLPHKPQAGCRQLVADRVTSLSDL
jgi:hypothetical protein